uniref:Uncharacterized protein n=1 Tax=Anguilla anguilla TaxID=7936 RepID=A0A0E9UPC9_ANGAN
MVKIEQKKLQIGKKIYSCVQLTLPHMNPPIIMRNSSTLCIQNMPFPGPGKCATV